MEHFIEKPINNFRSSYIDPIDGGHGGYNGLGQSHKSSQFIGFGNCTGGIECFDTNSYEAFDGGDYDFTGPSPLHYYV